MVQGVGHGYIMNNAPMELKKRCKNITASNDEGGILTIIEKSINELN